MDFEIATHTLDHCTVVAVRGELDLATAPLLEHELETHAGEPLVLDLSRTTFLDSWGVQAVVEGGPAGPRAVVCPSHTLRRLLQIAGTADVPVYDSLAHALAETDSTEEANGDGGWRSWLGRRR